MREIGEYGKVKNSDVYQIIRELKQKHGKLISNVIPDVFREEREVEVYHNEDGIVFIMEEPNRRRGFFSVANMSAFQQLMQKVPSGIVMEYLYHDQNDLVEFFEKAGMNEYAQYVRITIKYRSNPYEIPEKGRRVLLQKMYDPKCGEYPTIADADELYNITKDTFDATCDDIFTLDRWKEIIKNQECMVVRENGEILAYYVWRLEGKKLYSNMSVNKGPANLLYNIERRIFETMWDKGIRVFYAWFNAKNEKALGRSNKNTPDVIESYGYLYNAIYTN